MIVTISVLIGIGLNAISPRRPLTKYVKNDYNNAYEQKPNTRQPVAIINLLITNILV